MSADQLPKGFTLLEDEDPDLIKIKVRRHAKCWACNKDASDERPFTAQLSPLHRQPDGRRHTRETLLAELIAQGEHWRDTSKCLHRGCKDAALDSMLEIIDQRDAEAERLHAIELALIEARNEPAIAAFLERFGFTTETVDAP